MHASLKKSGRRGLRDDQLDGSVLAPAEAMSCMCILQLVQTCSREVGLGKQ